MLSAPVQHGSAIRVQVWFRIAALGKESGVIRNTARDTPPLMRTDVMISAETN
jgi:hypothetical protein